MKYWIVNWNPRTKLIPSSRIFKTFLIWPAPFETYGYKDDADFRAVKKGDVIFCYQKNQNSVVGVCNVVENPETDNDIGGTCLMLQRQCEPLKQPVSSKTNPVLQKIIIRKTLIELKEGGEKLLEVCRLAVAN